jgi:hypothetical protein
MSSAKSFVFAACIATALIACTGGRSVLDPTGMDAGGGKSSGCSAPNPECEGDNLHYATCATMGAGTGTLACDPATCTFDTSMCNQTPPSTGTGGLGGFPTGGRTARAGAGGRSGAGGRGTVTGGRAAPAAGRGGVGGVGGQSGDDDDNEEGGTSASGGVGGVGGEGGVGGGSGVGGAAGVGGESGSGGEAAGAGGEAAGAGGEAAGAGGEALPVAGASGAPG